MQARTIAATVLLATSSASCFAGQAGEPQYFLEGMHCLGEPFGLLLPSTLPELLAMGPILSEQVLQVEQWEGYKATRKIVRFTGLTLGLVTFSNDPKRYSLASAEIRSRDWLRLAPFSVGQSTEAVRQRLGGVGEDDLTLRSIYSGENESVRFETRTGRITAIIYECYTG
jgi:hypothetical protein